MKTIVAPTDFSAISLNAVNYAADLACVIGTSLSLIHVCPMPVVLTDVPLPEYGMTELVADAEEQMKRLTERIRYTTGERIKIITEVKQGETVPEIKDYCTLVNPYAVVMGAESAGAFERFLLGGKTFAAMEKLSWPLIIIPAGIKFGGIRKIGLACDLKKVLETVPVKEIRSLVKEFHAEFHVLHISTRVPDPFNAGTVKESILLRDILGGLHPIYHFIGSTDIEKSIIEFAEKNSFDLLIIIPRKHSVASKIFQHNYSKKLVLHTHVPVMAIHE